MASTSERPPLTARTKFAGRCPRCGQPASYTPLVPRGRSRAYAPSLPFMNVTCSRCGAEVTLIAEGYEDDPVAAGRARVHRAAPSEIDEDRCATCGYLIRQVPGGQGLTWVHSGTGAVAAASPVSPKES
jgi:ribosomal protein S27E